MASPGGMEGMLAALPEAIKKILLPWQRSWASQLRFGTAKDTPERCENFGAHLVPFVTATVANAEVAIEHRLDRIPRLVFSVMPCDVVNATMPVLVQTRVADARFLYLSSPTTDASVWIYVE